MDIFNSLIVSLPNEEIRLREENEDDNIEYKLRLDNKNRLGKRRLLSQLNYRLDIGKTLYDKKEAHYIIGIYDNGKLGKLIEKEINDSFDVFIEVIKDTSITMSYTDKKQYGEYFILHIILQKIENYKINELNIAFVGPSQHGKTTTISHLVYGQHDDAKGNARNLIFKHEHEKITGQTSSVKKEIIGLKDHKLINYSIGISTSWQDIVEMSDKVINLIDLPGNMKYFRSIFFGLSVYQIDGLVIVVDLTKLNITDYDDIYFYKTFSQKFNIPHCFLIINDDQNNLPSCYNDFSEAFDNLVCDSVIIEYSNLSSFGYDNLVNFIDTIKPNQNKKSMEMFDPLFYVLETYFVPDTGTIFSGIMKMGSISLDDEVWLTNGQTYYKTKVISIHRKQIDSSILYTNETGAIQLDFSNKPMFELNKHLIITKNKLNVCNYFNFECDCELIDSLSDGQMCVMFVNNSITNVWLEKSSTENKIKIRTEPNYKNELSATKIMIPIIADSIAFLKLDNKILFGTISPIYDTL